MKKVSSLPLLGVGVLSLGLVGLSVFTPVVNAAPNADSVFNVTVAEGAGIVTPTDPDQPLTPPTGADVTFGQDVNLALNPASTDSKTFGGTVINNTGAANLTLADKDTDTNLVHKTDNTKTIATADGAPAAAKAAWAVAVGKKTDQNLDFKAVPASNSKDPISVIANQQGSNDFYVVYAASAAADTAPGTYTDTLTYTLTAI